MVAKILGICPGTKTIGIAVLYNRELLKWRKHIFKEKWSNRKFKRIVVLLEKVISDNDITEVAIKTPDEIPISEAYIKVIGAINVLCEKRSIKPKFFTTSKLKDKFSHEKINKAELFELILRRYPELEVLTRQTINISRNACVYEAVAAASCINQSEA